MYTVRQNEIIKNMHDKIQANSIKCVAEYNNISDRAIKYIYSDLRRTLGPHKIFACLSLLFLHALVQVSFSSTIGATREGRVPTYVSARAYSVGVTVTNKRLASSLIRYSHLFLQTLQR
jgi:hypothetical protein